MVRQVETDRATRIERVVGRASDAVFGRPLVTNSFRGLLVEAMVANALEPEWRWCAADYASWDFEHPGGDRLEVKQSAARQSWSAPGCKPANASFDVAPRSGRWEGSQWLPEPGRSAHIYILAHHPVADDSADHRDPDQWTFYVVASANLPANKRVSLRPVRALAEACGYAALRDRVEAQRRIA